MSDFDSRDSNRRQEPSGFADLFADAEVVYVYTRAQALADGTLVDVSETAKAAGFVYPVAITAALWQDIQDIPEELAGYQTPEGRLWDVLSMGFHAIRQSKGDGSTLVYALLMAVGDETNPETEYRVKLVCGPGDHAEPVITLMRTNED
jgi:hypothetical protein